MALEMCPDLQFSIKSSSTTCSPLPAFIKQDPRLILAKVDLLKILVVDGVSGKRQTWISQFFINFSMELSP